MSGSAIAAVVAKKRKRIIQAFANAGATSPDTAKTLDELGLSGSPVLHIQKQRGVLVQVEGHRYYLDEEREAEVVHMRRVMVLAVCTFIIIILWIGLK